MCIPRSETFDIQDFLLQELLCTADLSGRVDKGSDPCNFS